MNRLRTSHGSAQVDGGRLRDRLSGRRRYIFEQFSIDLKKWPPAKQTQMVMTRNDEDIQIKTSINTSILLDGRLEIKSAELLINWWTHPPSIGDRFRIHYVQKNGYNCGWHRQENAHVEGLDHFQEQQTPEADPTYEAIEFAEDTPPGILWEVISGRLRKRLETRLSSTD